MVKHIIPKTLTEALEWMNQGAYQVISGGTDWMVQARNWSETLPKATKGLIFIHELSELNYIKETTEDLLIGATTPMDTLMNSPKVPQVLRDTLLEIAAPGIRHMATLAGNIANASPAADGLCTLVALDATVVIASVNSTRIEHVNDIIVAPKKINLSENELIIEIRIPKSDWSFTAFYKVGGRKADAISKVSLAGSVTYESDRISAWRIAFGAVGPKVVLNPDLDRMMIGKSVRAIKRDAASIVKLYEPFIKPIDDQRSTAAYRKQVALNLIGRFIENM
jgi:xanthine dehydrogenase FAD-binding subunit